MTASRRSGNPRRVSKLGQIQKRGNETYAKNAPPAKQTKLGARLADGRRGETVTVPELGEMRLELLGARETLEVDAAMYRNLAKLGIEQNGVTAGDFELERAVLTLARAARDPVDGTPFGTEAEWQLVDTRLVNTAWTLYGDVKDRLDPHADGCTDAERVLIETAIKKKEPRLLRMFGVVKLSDYMLSTADQPSTSPPPSLPSSESDPVS